MSNLNPLWRVIVLTISMFLICWIGFEVGKFLYSQIKVWTWAFDRHALWNIYMLSWCAIFLVYNLLLLFLNKLKYRKAFAILVALLLWVIPLLLFWPAIATRPLSVLAIHLVAVPSLVLRLLYFLKWGIENKVDNN